MTHTVKSLHTSAMGLAHAAIELNCQAAELESMAAGKVERLRENEPTRSILYRSAATLWLRANCAEEAQRYAEDGLRGSPPPSVKAELQAVLKEAKGLLKI